MAQLPESSSSDWRSFELEVAKLMTLQGYEVKPDRLVGARQSDLVATLRHGPCTTTVLVECKYLLAGKRVGVREVSDFCSRVANARISGIGDKGFLVTNTTFTRLAFLCVSSLNLQNCVSLLSYEDMEKSPLDFTYYVNMLVTRFQNMPLSSYMADLSCTTMEGQRQASISKFVLRWLRTKANQMCILGDYGTGKTSFCLYLACFLAKQYLQSPNKARIPLLIELKEYAKAGGVRPMVTDLLVNECGITNGRYQSFRRMLESGRFILLLDGFDEMTARTDMQTIYDSFRDLSALNCPNGKLIITGRPGYFPDLEEMNRIIRVAHEPKEEVGESDYEDIASLYLKAEPYRVISVDPLDKRRIEGIVKARASYIEEKGYSASTLLEELNNKEKYDLADLARRPVLLDMIVESFCQLGDKFEAANTARLYEVYTSLWIERDRAKGEFRRLVDPEDKKVLMEEIGWMMFKTAIPRVHYAELPDTVGQHFEFASLQDKELVSHDLMTGSFLIRDDKGYYIFAHKSFMEFFVAMKLYRDIRRGMSDSLGESPLTDEVCDFLADLVKTDDTDLQPILKEMVSEACLGASLPPLRKQPLVRSIVTAAGNGIAVLSRIEHALDGADLTGINLVDARLSRECDVLDAVLNGSFLKNVRFTACTMSGLSVKDSMWHNVDCNEFAAHEMIVETSTFAGCLFRNAAMVESHWRDVTLKGCDFEKAWLDDAILERCRCVGASFARCSFKNATLTDCDLRKADLRGANLDSARLIRVNLEGTDLREANLDTCHFEDCSPTGR